MPYLADVNVLSKPGLVHCLGFLTNRGKRFFRRLGARHVRVIAVLGDKHSVIDFSRGRPAKCLIRCVSGCLGRILECPKLMKSRKCGGPFPEIEVKASDIFLDLNFKLLELAEFLKLNTWHEASRKRRLADMQLTALLQQPLKNPEPTFSCPKPEFIIAARSVPLDCEGMEETDSSNATGELLLALLWEGFPIAVFRYLDVIEVHEDEGAGHI